LYRISTTCIFLSCKPQTEIRTIDAALHHNQHPTCAETVAQLTLQRMGLLKLCVVTARMTIPCLDGAVSHEATGTEDEELRASSDGFEEGRQ